MENNIFFKYSGAGNTFLISKEKSPSKLLEKKHYIKRICHPVTGFAADGVLYLTKTKNLVVWEFYNADGSGAEMCGNAARCAYSFSREHFFNENKPNEITFSTKAGLIQGRQVGKKIAITMTVPQAELGTLKQALFKNELGVFEKKASESKELKETTKATKLTEVKIEKKDFLSIDTGVPHLVIQINELRQFRKLEDLCRKLRNHGMFKRGTNVTLVEVVNKNSAKAVTFERGVEGFTLACGTGAVAAAIYMNQNTDEYNINVEMPGGMLLVDLDPQKIKAPDLIGEATLVGKVIILGKDLE